MDERLAIHLELSSLSDEQFVDRAYRLLVRRPPDAQGRVRALEALAYGRLSRATLIAELAGSDEFARVRALDDAVALAALAREDDRRLRGLTGPAAGDERVIEIPWTLARLRGERRALDVGYANAEPAYLAALVAACPDEPTGADLLEAEVPGIRSVVADARSLPFDDEAFDVVLCVSTLEHVGLDNRLYGAVEERDEEGIATALKEFRRVLAPEGRLLLTVPTGLREDHGGFVQLPPAEWLSLFEDAGFTVFEQEAYARGPEQWESAGDADLSSLPYAGTGAAAVLCAELRPAGLGQRARRRLGRLTGGGT
jgi:SAM-dependent methyltransferase